MKILKNIFKSLIAAIGLWAIIIFFVPSGRFYLFSQDLIGIHHIIILILSILSSFVFFNSDKDSLKKISGVIFVGLLIYLPTSILLMSVSSPWKKTKFDVAWSNKPIYLSEAVSKNNNLRFIHRWEANKYNGKYAVRLLIDNSFCSSDGEYVMRLKGEQSRNVIISKFNNNTLQIYDNEDFNQVTNWKIRGQKILLISDSCGTQHEIDLTGYNPKARLIPSNYEEE